MNEDRQAKTKRPTKPRIIIMDDEDVMLDMMETFVRDWCHEVTVLRFQNRDEASQELLRCVPDLLITDMRSDNVPGRSGEYGMSGFELLKLLAERLVKHPILVASGSFSMNGCEGLARQCAGPHLNVLFLTKPFTRELFLRALRQCLGPSGETGRGTRQRARSGLRAQLSEEGSASLRQRLHSHRLGDARAGARDSIRCWRRLSSE
jgi:CheY-like chemotaxis protein